MSTLSKASTSNTGTNMSMRSVKKLPLLPPPTTASNTPYTLPISRLVVDCSDGDGTVMKEQQPYAASCSSSSSSLCGNPPGIWGNLSGSQCDDWFRFQVTSAASAVAVSGNGSSSSSSSQKSNANANSHTLSRLQAALVEEDNSNGDCYCNKKNATGFSVAVWFTVTPRLSLSSSKQEDDDETSILSLGAKKNDTSWRRGCSSGYDFEISYAHTSNSYSNKKSDAVILRYLDSDEARTCRVVRLDAPARNSTILSEFLVHAVVSWTNESLSVYLQGQVVASTPLSPPFDTTLRAWDPMGTLQLLRSISTSTTSDVNNSRSINNNHHQHRGYGIHQVDFYSQHLRLDEVAQLYRQGFIKKTRQNGSEEEEEEEEELAEIEPQISTVVELAQDRTEPLSFNMGGRILWKRDLSILSTSSNGDDEEADDDDDSNSGISLLVNWTTLPLRGYLTRYGKAVQDSYLLPLRLENATTVSLSLNYTLVDHDYFNLPPLVMSEDVPMEVVEAVLSVVWNKNQMVLARRLVTIPIQVLHVNRPPTLTAPAHIQAADTTTFISGLTLEDPDADVRMPVRVDVSTSHNSLLTLNSQHSSLADFVTCRTRSDSPWQCVGDGVGDRTMIFLAEPRDVNDILVQLQVDAVQDETVTFRVYDGQGGNCLSAREHAQYVADSALTIHRDNCFQVEASVQIVLDKNAKNKYPFSSSPDAANVSRIADLLFWGLTIALGLGILACLRRCGPRCLARGGAIEADDGNNNSNPTGTTTNNNNTHSIHSCSSTINDDNDDSSGKEDVEEGEPSSSDASAFEEDCVDVDTFCLRDYSIGGHIEI